MILFGFPTSPYVRKCLVIAAEKTVETQLIPATPHKPTPEFLEASPFRMMPAMQDGDFRLADSTAIAFYLDAKYPRAPLLPADTPENAQARGHAMWMDEFADTILSTGARGIAFNRFIGPALLGIPANEEAAAEAEAKAIPALDYLESQVPADGWLLDEYSLADIAVASCLKTMSYGLDVKTRAKTAAWLERVEARPAWRSVAAQEAAMIEAARASGGHKPS